VVSEESGRKVTFRGARRPFRISDTPDRTSSSLTALFRAPNSPGEDELAEAQAEDSQSDGIDLIRKANEFGKIAESGVDLRIESGIEEHELPGRPPEKGLGVFAIQSPPVLDIFFPVLQPSRSQEERSLLEVVVENVFVREPFETQAFLDGRASFLQSRGPSRLAQAKASDEKNRIPLTPAFVHDVFEARPIRLELVAIDRVGLEGDIEKIGMSGEGPDLALERRAKNETESGAHPGLPGSVNSTHLTLSKCPYI
jgi:hypothetical protein